MVVVYRISPEILSELKDPFGMLIEGSPAETMSKLKEIVKKEEPPKVISVGDIVSRSLHLNKIIPQLSITDNQSLRKKLRPQVFPDKILIQVKNPQGTITKESIEAIEKALKENKSAQIIVDGEEDLLTLITVLKAPENTLVIYGQPNEGIVVVKVSPEKKAKVARILEKMKIPGK
jgi:GTP-dependent dephospho-CoA kinase